MYEQMEHVFTWNVTIVFDLMSLEKSPYFQITFYHHGQNHWLQYITYPHSQIQLLSVSLWKFHVLQNEPYQLFPGAKATHILHWILEQHNLEENHNSINQVGNPFKRVRN